MRPEGLSYLKNSSDSIGNRTRDLPAYSAVPQPTAPPRAQILQDIVNQRSIFYEQKTESWVYLDHLQVLEMGK